MALKQFTFIFLFFFSLLSYSQYYKRTQLDSLKKTLQKQEGIEEIETGLELANAYLLFQLDTAQLYIKLARDQSVKLGYEWGICKSYFIASNIQLRKGNSRVIETFLIKEQCAHWFEQHHFNKDALLARISANTEYIYHAGHHKAFKKAELYLKQAQDFNDPELLGLAWDEISRARPDFFHNMDYPSSKDSALFYMNQTQDSLRIIRANVRHLFRKTSGVIPKPEIVELEKIANRWQNPMLWVSIEKIKGFIFVKKGVPDSSLYYVNRINKIRESYGGPDIYRPTSEFLAFAYREADDHREMIKYLLEILVENEKYGVQTELAHNLHNLGQSYFVLKEYDLAISYWLKALPLLEELEDHYLASSVRRSLGDLYVITGENEKAEHLYLEVIEWAVEQEDILAIDIMLGNAYASLGQLYQKESKYDKAFSNYAFSIDRLKNSPTRLVEPKTHLLSMYLDMGEIGKADSLHQEIVSKLLLGGSARRIEELYFEEGRLEMALQNYPSAIESLNSFLTFGTSNDINKNKKKANFLLYEAHKALNQSPNALASFEAYKVIDDSLQSQVVIQNVQKKLSDYEISLKESEIERLEQQQEISDLKLIQQDNELSLRKQFNVILIFTFLLLAVIGYFVYRRLQFKKEEEKTEIKKLVEIEKLKSSQKAELAQIKDNLYANISHEFKTPLTLIRVPLQNFRIKASTEDRPAFDSVIKNTDHLLEMLDELLGISKMESGLVKLNPSHFDFASFLAQIKLNFAPLFTQKKIRFEWRVDLDQNSLYGDENKLLIVINNLLKNACSNTPHGGWVICDFRSTQELIIQVTNSGRQISEKDLPHLFERFYRSSGTAYAGSGIGLAWSKQIIELHQGTIDIDNTKSAQVTFLIKLPNVVNEARLIAIPNKQIEGKELEIKKDMMPDVVDAFAGELPHILVVEDNDEMRALLKSILNTQFRLDFAENGEIGEDMAIQLQPDLVLSDIMMPKMDGFELLKSLKENFNTSHIPVVLLTAREDSVSRIKGLNQNADDYIEKPFDLTELIARIDNILRQRRSLHKLFNENPLLYSKEIKCTSVDAEFIDRTRQVLEDNYTDLSFTLNQLCIALGSNRTSINAKIKALTNQTTAEYIKNFRLHKAVIMLTKTNATMVEIYIDNGFKSPQAFNKMFKKKFCCTPSEYRHKFAE